MTLRSALRTITAVFCAGVAIAGWTATTPADDDGFTWATVNLAIRTAYPNVRSITTAELQAWLADDKHTPLLLDTRAKDEYAVSHLADARLATSLEDALAVLSSEDKDRLVVTYCSVGYRSGGMAKALAARGYTNVYNLEGSIFLWANQERPVYRGEERVAEVHPYDRMWGVLLDRRYWPESLD